MTRLASEVRPRVYTLHVTLDPRRDDFRGELEIELEAPRGRRAIELHSVDLDILKVEVFDSSGSVGEVRLSARPRREAVSLRFPRGLRSTSARVRISYTGRLRDDLRGLYLARSGRKRYAATQLEAADARRFFPCFDEPDKKARFRISVTTPLRNSAVSNAPIERERSRGHLKTVHFAETPKLSTYLVALIVGELSVSRARHCGKTPIRVWHVPGKEHLTRFALEAAAESLERLERYFGLPYPYAKLDLLAVPDFEFGAMENAGAVTFRENLLLVDPATVSLAERKRVAEVIAHELAHMWFGDLVTMAWWDDLWLNEAFATWMAFSIVDDWQPGWRMWLDFQHHRGAAFALDSLQNTHPIYTEVRTPDEATENFDAITYEKGASVVRMIERWLGAPAFRRGVRRYIRRHREGNARAADLWNALEEASGQPVAPVVRAWIERAGFPLLTVKQTRRRGRTSLSIRQERFFSSPRGLEAERRSRWPIPLVIRIQPTRGRSRELRTLVDQRRQRIELGPSDELRWAYANSRESGFFRPLHDAKLLRSICADLGHLEPVERIGLITHQWAGVRADRATLSDFLELVGALGREPEPEVLEAVAGPLAWLTDQVAPSLGEDERRRFLGWIADVFTPAFSELGFDAGRREPDERRLRRAALLRLTGGIAEHRRTVREAESRLAIYLKKRSSLDPNLAAGVVEIAARGGNKGRYEAYLRTMRRARTPQERTRFELGLAGFRDAALVARTLRLTVSPDVPTQDVVPLLARLLANPQARDATWHFIRDSWSVLSPRISTGLASRLIASLPALQTLERRREVAAFFRTHPVPSASRSLKQALERFDLDTELRRRAKPVLESWLQDRRVPHR